MSARRPLGPGARVSIGVAVVGALVLGIFAQTDRTEFTRSSFGTIPAGYGALVDLWTELGLPVRRSYAAPEALAATDTVWWIEPARLCEKLAAAEPREAEGEPGEVLPREWDVAGFVARGGRAVVFLPHEPLPCDAELAIAGLAVPPRPSEFADGGERAGDDEATGAEDGGGGTAEEESGGFSARRAWEYVTGGGAGEEESGSGPVVSGDLTPQPRRLGNFAFRSFEDPADEDWEILATLDGAPFALQAPVGAGTLVLVADAAFLANQHIDRRDASLLALDLALRFGPPRIDEREHGMRPGPGALGYVARSAATPLFAGIGLLGLVYAWRGASLPPRRSREPGGGAPTLDAFVDSVATLYAESRDWSRIAARFRELATSRIRRTFSLPLETPLEDLVARVRRTPHASEEAVRLLAGEVEVAGERDAVLRAARALEALVRDVSR